MLTPEAKALNMQIELKKPRSDVRVAIDKMRTQQILINLVQNAIKYSDRKGKIYVTVTVVHVPDEPECVGVIFSVYDQGKGIPKDQRSDLFRPYYRAKNAK